MSAILKFDIQKKKTITFFWSKVSRLHKKDPILHVTTTFSLKQEETRTSSGPIPHPLKQTKRQNIGKRPVSISGHSDENTKDMHEGHCV